MCRFGKETTEKLTKLTLEKLLEIKAELDAHPPMSISIVFDGDQALLIYRELFLKMFDKRMEEHEAECRP